MKRPTLLLAALAATAALGAGSAAAATPAASYCAAKGGAVSWSTLAGGARVGLCTFHRASDDTSISVGLRTLASRTPTQAVLAYLGRPKADPTTGGANPASIYCGQLGGTELLDGICRFADGSMIDSWGLGLPHARHRARPRPHAALPLPLEVIAVAHDARLPRR